MTKNPVLNSRPAARREPKGPPAAERDVLVPLDRACSRLWDSRNLDEGLEKILAAAIELLNADMGAVQLFDPCRGVLTIAVQSGFSDDFLESFREVLSTDESACGQALRSGERVVIEDVEMDPSCAPFRMTASAAGFRGVQATPLTGRDGTLLGVISTHFRTPFYAAESDFRLLDLYARQAAHFIERCRADATQSESEEMLRLFVEHTPAAVAMFDREMRYLAASSRWREGFGIEASPIGRFHYEIFPEIPERWKEVHRRGLRGEVVSADEERFERRDGRVQWLRWEMRPWIATNGAVGGIIIFSEDISERKEAEEALRESEERYRALIDATSQVIYRMSPDWSELRQLQGGGFVADTESLNRNWLEEYIHPDDRKLVLEATEEAVRTGTPLELEHRVRRVDGSIGWTFSRAVPVRDAAGEIVEWFGAANDITERKEAEELLREAKANLEGAVAERTAYLDRTVERLKVEVAHRTSAEEVLRKNEALLGTVLETLPVGVALVDEEGRPFYLNPALAEIWEGEVTECGACRIWQEGSELSLLSADHPVAVALRNDEPVMGVVQEIETFSGKRKSVITSASPILMPDGSKAGGVFVMQDITQQQELQKQLLHAQKLDSIGSLAGGVAHDFNNILTIICGYVESVYEQLEGDDDLRNELRQVLEAGAKATDLTRKLLTFSRQQVAETAPMSLTETVENVLSFVSRLIGAQIEVRRQLSAERLTIRGSKGQIEQVLVNILLNSRDAIADTGTVTVRTGKVKAADAAVALPDEGSYAFVEIADSGEGIAPQNLDRIFEPYFTTKEQDKGTGLGMAIAYGIIRQHHGAITVTSVVGQGTTFTVYLPLTTRRGKACAEPERGELPNGRETVLVVEDEAMVRSYTEMALRKAGYFVVTACDGSEALEAIREHPVDIVLADVIMPGMNGMEMYRRMREFMPGLKVIFASGYSADIVTAKGVAEGKFRFLQKPVSKATLLTTIREVLDGEGGGT